MRNVVKALGTAAIILFAAQAPLTAAKAAAVPPAALPAAEATAEAVTADPGPPYLFEHACKTGISVSILTPDIKVQQALQKLFAGGMTPYEFLDFMRTNARPASAARDEEAARDMLSKCMEIQIHRI